MTLSDTIAEAMAAWQPLGPGRVSWSHALPSAGWNVALSADRADSVGSVVWDLTLNRTGPSPAGLTTRSWADRVASRVTGLLEPLRVVEVDDAGAEAILRSVSPSRKGPTVGYYEIALKGTTQAIVRRYQSDTASQTPRVQVGYALTHEVLAKLAEDVIRD